MKQIALADIIKDDRLVETNIGRIPLMDYLDIVSMQYGYDDYEDLRSDGLELDMPFLDLWMKQHEYKLQYQQLISLFERG